MMRSAGLEGERQLDVIVKALGNRARDDLINETYGRVAGVAREIVTDDAEGRSEMKMKKNDA